MILNKANIILLIFYAGLYSTILFAATDCTQRSIEKYIIMQDVSHVKDCVNRKNINIRNQYGSQLIHLAAGVGNIDVLKNLVGNGADINSVDINDRTPAYFSTEYGKSNALKWLVDNGASVGVMAKDRLSLIDIAIKNNREDVVRYLANYSGLITNRDSNGAYPLHWAARVGNPSIVQVLIQHGAKADVVDNKHEQPLHWASRFGNFYNSALIDLLRKAGGRLDSKNINGETPVYLAKHLGDGLGNNKGMLDESVRNLLSNEISPVLIKNKLCTSSEDCFNQQLIMCLQASGAIYCDIRGVQEDPYKKNIEVLLGASGVKIGRLRFF